MVEASLTQAPSRNAHPVMMELVGGLELSAAHLSRRPDASRLGSFSQMLSNAEYWISFDLASFEVLLARSPSPLRELGVAVLLRFSEHMAGELTRDAIEQARSALVGCLAADLEAGVANGLETLARAVAVRDRRPQLEAEGFKLYTPGGGMSVHALRAMGHGHIFVEGRPDRERKLEVKIGEPLVLRATDERSRPTVAPDVESRAGAPVLLKEDKDALTRTIILMVPGEYVLRVPGKAAGDRRLLAT